MRRRGQCALLLGMSVVIASCASTPQKTMVLTGTWGWTEGGPSCAENPHTITFTADQKFMDLTMRDPVTARWGETIQTVRYRILERTPDYLRTQIIGEKEKAPDGSLVVWDVIGLSPDHYCWHRTDWPPGACTAKMERCKP